MDLKLRGRRALVTGSTAGIGRAIAASLASECASVIVNGRLQSSVDKAVVELQATTGGDLVGFAGDLGSGLLYGLARLLGWGQAPVLVAVADYGTKFIVVAGLLNVVAAVDAHSLASGRKPS